MLPRLPLLLLCTLLLPALPARADGTAFVFAFPAQYAGQILSVRIAARTAADATVEVPGLAFSQTVAVPAMGVAVVTLPATAQAGASGSTTDRAVRVTSTAPVVVVAMSQQAGVGADSFAVHPLGDLGTSHRVLSVPAFVAAAAPSQLVIVATQAGTTVTITPPANDTLPANIPTNIPLGALQVYALHASASGADLTGTSVVADHPVAVIAGHQLGQVQLPFADPLLEMMPADDRLGAPIVITTTPGRTVHRLRIVGVDASSVLTYSPPIAGAPTNFTGGSVAEFSYPSDTLINVVGKVLVGQLMPGGQTDGATAGDPSLLVALPTSAWSDDPLFIVPNVYTVTVKVLARCVDVSSPAGVRLDGVPIAAASFAQIGTSAYCRAVLTGLAPGAHALLADNPVNAHVFGQAPFESYAHGVEIGGGDSDVDGDDIPDGLDNCPLVANPGQEDADGDGDGNACDNCPATLNPDQSDTSGDGIGDRCQNGDFNGDGTNDIVDITLQRRKLAGMEPELNGAMPPTEP